MQIIENFRLRPDPRNYGTHENIPQKVCDEVNDYTPFEIIRYLEGFNEACKAAGKTVVVEVFIEYSPDPIGSLTKCPAMGGWYRGTVYLGDVVSVFHHLYNVTRQRFVGYYDKPTQTVISVDFYSAK